jgi:hypothetical protein
MEQLVRRLSVQLMSHFFIVSVDYGFPDDTLAARAYLPAASRGVTSIRHVDLGHEAAASH